MTEQHKKCLKTTSTALSELELEELMNTYGPSVLKFAFPVTLLVIDRNRWTCKR